VTAVSVAPGIDPEALRSVARERYQVAMSGGLGPLAGRVFRSGHMGDINAAMLLGCLAGIEAALRAQRVDIGDGALAAALAALDGCFACSCERPVGRLRVVNFAFLHRGGKGACGQAAALRWCGLRFASTSLRCSVSRPRRRTRYAPETGAAL
jgi:hypothetical protein